MPAMTDLDMSWDIGGAGAGSTRFTTGNGAGAFGALAAMDGILKICPHTHFIRRPTNSVFHGFFRAHLGQ
jgi:hypothetical protein